MTDFATIPLWIILPIALFLVIGSTLTLLGAIGLVRLKSFYDRIHAPTLGTSWGTAGIVIASMLFGSYIEGRAVIHEIALGLFITITTPVTLILLGRAALHRDRLEKADHLPEELRSLPEARDRAASD
ncbi:MAG: cation:proton antiporter [Sneathiella sp.]|jgi:multicomponent K+:H+ antiporter subunit G|uniref:monovalent cation/H(+) antiporter subunit G n=1 Tax=Sneathiella sp. TaxID=1964365 RepID=UPI000C5E2455|nr:monovalent cation/H(+) antiporter subunit G [Sneathiella sp.]MAL80268.1 cation:proton antiporter [Sneathiella sp.]|tara:strand:- start:645 stop:1028 length:384 start_codon:yes stop_codon:yes gene_type:complete